MTHHPTLEFNTLPELPEGWQWFRYFDCCVAEYHGLTVSVERNEVVTRDTLSEQSFEKQAPIAVALAVLRANGYSLTS